MFCPNCGTKNSDTEQKCSQCGLSLKKPDEKAKFKGTMVMQGTPAPRKSAPDPTSEASAGAGKPGVQARQAPDPSLKGTMIGVAPPDMQAALDAARAKAAAAQQQAGGPKTVTAPQTRRGTPTERTPGTGSVAGGSVLGQRKGSASGLKGTMIGVAPPKMEEAIAAAQAAGATPETRAKANPLKGTMIGVAPPDMQAAISAARQSAGEQRGPEKSAPERGSRREEQQPPPMPSQLKGTMIGVAPPDMQAAISAAKAKAEPQGHGSAGRDHLGGRDSAAARKRDLGSTRLSGTDPTNQETRADQAFPSSPTAPQPEAPDAGVDAFQGTLLGQNPLAGGPAHHSPPPSPPALESFGGTQPMPTREAASPGAGAIGETPPQALAGGTVAMPQIPSPDQMGSTAFGKTVKSDAPPPTGLNFGLDRGLPIEAEPKSGSPILLLLVAVVVVGALLATVLFFGSSGGAEETPEESSGQATPETSQTLNRK